MARRFGAPDGLPAGVGRNGLYQDPEGVLWVADREGQVYRSDGDADASSLFRQIPARSDMGPVLTMVRDAAGALWVSDAHRTRFRDGRWTVAAATGFRGFVCGLRGRGRMPAP